MPRERNRIFGVPGAGMSTLCCQLAVGGARLTTMQSSPASCPKQSIRVNPPCPCKVHLRCPLHSVIDNIKINHDDIKCDR